MTRRTWLRLASGCGTASHWGMRFQRAAALGLGTAAAVNAADAPLLSHSEPCMGTMFSIRAYHPGEAAGYQAIGAAFQRMHALDALLSDYKPQSELNQVCLHAYKQPVTVSEDLFRVLEAALQLAHDTNGAFDVSLGPVIRLWRSARQARQLPDTAALQSAMSRTGWRKITLDAATRSVCLGQPGMQLDLGGIAKGYAAGEALAVLARHGVEAALVAAGGDVAVSAPPPAQTGWRVALESGREHPKPLLRLARQAVSTSGDLHQSVEIDGLRYSHIVDPRTGLGLTDPLSVSVVTKDPITADATATALSVMGFDAAKEWLRRHRQVEGRIIHGGFGAPADVWQTPSFPLEAALTASA